MYSSVIPTNQLNARLSYFDNNKFPCAGNGMFPLNPTQLGDMRCVTNKLLTLSQSVFINVTNKLTLRSRLRKVDGRPLLSSIVIVIPGAAVTAMRTEVSGDW